MKGLLFLSLSKLFSVVIGSARIQRIFILESAMPTQDVLLDSYSLKILQELQHDARQTIQQLAERVGLSAPPCWKRIKEMEDAMDLSVRLKVDARLGENWAEMSRIDQA